MKMTAVAIVSVVANPASMDRKSVSSVPNPSATTVYNRKDANHRQFRTTCTS